MSTAWSGATANETTSGFVVVAEATTGFPVAVSSTAMSKSAVKSPSVEDASTIVTAWASWHVARKASVVSTRP